MHNNFDDYDKTQAATPQSAIDPNRGVDIRQRKVGETILVETDNGIYELSVVDPVRRLVQVTGTDPRLHTPTIGCLDYSISALNRLDKREAWIGPARRMILVFRNATLVTGAVSAATIRGDGWRFDVF